ncbi:MAG: tetratricopeptide repeat protein [Phycisphaerae bacterium]
MYLSGNQLEQALREFDEALQFDPKLASAYSKIGKIHRRRGELAEAARAFAQALQLDPMDFLSALSLGQVYQALAEKSPDKLEKLRLAVQAYMQAADLRPDNVETQLNLGICYHQIGELDQAISAYKAALKLDPKNAFAFVNLGAAYDSKGNFYDAIRMYKSAMELGDNQPVVLAQPRHHLSQAGPPARRHGNLPPRRRGGPQVGPGSPVDRLLLLSHRPIRPGGTAAYGRALATRRPLRRGPPAAAWSS